MGTGTVPASHRTADEPLTRRGTRTHTFAAGLFTVLSLVMLYPMPLQLATRLRDLGDPLEYAWVLGYSYQRLLTDPLRLFDGNIFYPFKLSLAYSDSTIASTLLSLPVLVGSGNPVLATNLLILASFVLCGFGTYLLVHDLTGSKAAGVLAGIVFAFCPFRLDHLSQIPNASIEWMPFVFYSVNRLARTHSGRWAVLLWLFLSLQFLSSLYYAFVVGIALGVYLICLAVLRRQVFWRRRFLVPLAAALLGAVVVLAATSLSYFEVSRMYDMKRTLAEAEHFSARPRDYLMVPSTNRLWLSLGRLVHVGAGERMLFPGLLALCLGAIGLVRGRPRSVGVALALVGASGMLISFGPVLQLNDAGSRLSLPFPTPYQMLYDYLPGFQSMRVPARFGIAVAFAVSVLAGMGVAVVIGRLRAFVAVRRPRLRRGLPVAGAALLCLVALAEYFSAPIPSEPVPTGAEVPQVYRWLAEQPGKSTLVEIPIGNTYREGMYEYFSVYHGWTLVNGWRSFQPPGYSALVQALRSFPSDSAIAAATDLRLKYVVVHFGKLDPVDAESRHRLLERYSEKVTMVAKFGDDEVYALAPSVKPTVATASVASTCNASSAATLGATLRLTSPTGQLVILPDTPSEHSVSAIWTAKNGTQQITKSSLTLTRPVNPSSVGFALPLQTPSSPGVYGLQLRFDPPLPGGVVDPEPVTVVVAPKGEAPALPTISSEALQLVSAEPLSGAASVDSGVPVRLTWRAHASGQLRGVEFANVYDSGFHYWHVTEPSLQSDSATWCDGEEVTETRDVPLLPDTKPGYYSVEVGLKDPTSDARLRFHGPTGESVDKFTVGLVRVAPDSQLADEASPPASVTADFGSQIRLAGATVRANAVKPGSSLPVSVYWQATKPVKRDYSAFVHVYAEDGRLVAQYDGSPGHGAWPTSKWQPGDTIRDDVEVSVPSAVGPGTYVVAVGLYDQASGQRLEVASDATMGDQRVELATIRVSN